MRKLKEVAVNIWIGMHGNKEKLFTKYYLNNSWGDPESRSGTGSTLEHNEKLRSQLYRFFEKYRIESIFNAPCGNFNRFRFVSRKNLNYIGGDIVRPLIDENEKKFADEKTRFCHFDITKDSFPTTDLWLCRDVLFHFSEEDIYRALGKFVDSGIPWILTTTFPEHVKNHDIPTGSFRLLNLEKPPFNFCPPIDTLVDSVEGWQKRILGLWDRESVMQVLRMKGSV